MAISSAMLSTPTLMAILSATLATSSAKYQLQHAKHSGLPSATQNKIKWQ